MGLSVAPEAVNDPDGIWYFIAKETGDPDRADRVTDAIWERFRLLSAHPRVGRKRDDLRRGLRNFPVNDYLIIYRVSRKGDVFVLRVLHSSRDIDRPISSRWAD